MTVQVTTQATLLYPVGVCCRKSEYNEATSEFLYRPLIIEESAGER
jgi:hypothetical protein